MDELTEFVLTTVIFAPGACEHRSRPTRFVPFPGMPPMPGMPRMPRMSSERLFFVGRLHTWSPFARKVMLPILSARCFGQDVFFWGRRSPAGRLQTRNGAFRYNQPFVLTKTCFFWGRRSPAGRLQTSNTAFKYNQPTSQRLVDFLYIFCFRLYIILYIYIYILLS